MPRRVIVPASALVTQTEQERRAALGVGDLVYYDAIRSGQVPCRVVDVVSATWPQSGDRLVLRVTGARYAYPRGHEFTTHRGPFVQARGPIR